MSLDCRTTVSPSVRDDPPEPGRNGFILVLRRYMRKLLRLYCVLQAYLNWMKCASSTQAVGCLILCPRPFPSGQSPKIVPTTLSSGVHWNRLIADGSGSSRETPTSPHSRKLGGSVEVAVPTRDGLRQNAPLAIHRGQWRYSLQYLLDNTGAATDVHNSSAGVIP